MCAVICCADQAEGGFLVHGRPASEYRTHKPTAAISDFSVNKTRAGALAGQRPPVPEPQEPAVAGGLPSAFRSSCMQCHATGCAGSSAADRRKGQATLCENLIARHWATYMT